VNRRKVGLRSPIVSWLAAPLPDFARDLLSEASLRKTGLFEPKGVRALLDEHRGGRANRSIELMAVLGVQTWDALFVRGESGLI
jgi:asparagine synthase (glutamine-hydrolysing)